MTSPPTHRLLAAAVLLALVGCAPALPPLERYRLRPVLAPAESVSAPASAPTPAPVLAPAAAGAPGDSAAAEETITVEPYATIGIYAEPQIVYRVGETSYGSYPDREWALPLSAMLAELTVEILRAAPSRPGRVIDDRDAGAHRLVWRGVVREFEEVNRGEQVSVAVHLDGTVMRAMSDSVLWQGSAQFECPVTDATMPAVVDALSAAAAVVVSRLVRDAGSALGRVTGARR